MRRRRPRALWQGRLAATAAVTLAATSGCVDKRASPKAIHDTEGDTAQERLPDGTVTDGNVTDGTDDACRNQRLEGTRDDRVRAAWIYDSWTKTDPFGERGLWAIVLSTYPLGCGEALWETPTFDTMACGEDSLPTGWEATLVLPREMQSVGVHDLSGSGAMLLFKTHVHDPDCKHTGGGSGSSNVHGILEIFDRSETCWTGAIRDFSWEYGIQPSGPDTPEVRLDFAFAAMPCG